MTKLEDVLAEENAKHAEQTAKFVRKLAQAEAKGKLKDIEKFKKKITEENLRYTTKLGKIQAKFQEEANAVDEDVPVEPAVVVTHGWIWGYFEPFGTALKERNWKRAAGQLVLRVLPIVIVLLIALNALKTLLGLNN